LSRFGVFLRKWRHASPKDHFTHSPIHVSSNKCSTQDSSLGYTIFVQLKPVEESSRCAANTNQPNTPYVI